ncbi:DUF1343 domain-containing protein [soil metagenome]
MDIRKLLFFNARMVRSSRRSSSYGGQAGRLLLSMPKGHHERLKKIFLFALSLSKSASFFLLIFCSLLNAAVIDFKLGIENIPTNMVAQYAKKKTPVALITNQTGRDQKGNRTLDILLKKGFNVVVIFAPEHGFDGKSNAAQEVKDGIDVKTKIPVMSLYGKGTGRKIAPEAIKDIQAFFFDIQDSGMRHYTYISTLLTVLKTGAADQKQIIVFDRPNPLGKTMEGPLVEPALISFISIAPIPLRHGMTIGELADYFNTHVLESKAPLTVIGMRGYDRSQGLDLMHAPLSPNIASRESCHGYCFLGLLGEIKPFDVGVGTPHSFQLISLPASMPLPLSFWQELSERLRYCGIVATAHQYMHEKKKEQYIGLRLCMENINQVNAFNAFLITVSSAKKAGIAIDFQREFDKAVGSSRVRSFLTGGITYQDLVGDVNKDLQLFFQKAQPLFRYAPHPELIFN